MATYLPGVTDYIPKLQPFRPDFNFYSGALQMKQGKYDAAHNSLSNLYGSLLNAPMLRDDNIKARDQFFDTIGTDIQKMSGLDLSLQQNTDAAAGVFNQMLEDDNIVKDMVWTKNWQKEHQRADGFRGCIDVDKCGGSWWEGGVKALNYRADEFRKATNQDALTFGNARFSPYQDVMKRAIDLADAAGLSMEIDQLQGRYIVTQKNGPALIQPLQNLFTGSIANDPAVLDYYRTKAYVDRKDRIASTIPIYGSEEAAEKAYLNDMGKSMTQFFTQQKGDLGTTSKHLDSQRKQLEQKIQTQGTGPGSTLAQEYQNLKDTLNGVNSSYQVASDSLESGKLMQSGQSAAISAEQLDRMLAAYYLNGEIGDAAKTLAFKDYQYKLEADPYAMENVKHANRLSLEGMRFEHDKLLELFKFDLDQYDKKLTARGDYLSNIANPVDVVGAANPELAGEAAYQQYTDLHETLEGDISKNERLIMNDVMQLTQQKSLSEQGKGIASADLLAFGDSLFGDNGYMSEDKKKDIKWNRKTDTQKVDYMQQYDFSKSLLNNQTGVSGTAIDQMYNSYLTPLMDMKDPSNRVNRDYLSGVWANNATRRNDISWKNKTLQTIDNWYATESGDVLDNINNEDSPWKDYHEILKHYVDTETGEVRNEEDFLRSYGTAFRNSLPNERTTEHEIYLPPEESKYHTGPRTHTVTTAVDKDAETAAAIEQARLMYQGGKSSYGGTGRELLGSESLGEQLTGAAMVYTDPTGALGEDVPSLDTIWKQAWSKHMTADGGANWLAVSGAGSLAAQGLNVPLVDPAAYQSMGTMNTLTFMQDAFTKSGSRTVMGGPDMEVPEGTDDAAQQILKQVYIDMVNMNDIKDQKRPMLNVTYQDIAGQDKNWTALNLKLNENYMGKYQGSEDSPGLMRGLNAGLATEGLTVYLPKDQATNGFRKGVDKSLLEQSVFYTGRHNFDAYPSITQDMALHQNPSGGYTVKGSIQKGLNEDGTPAWEPVVNNYPDPASDINRIVSDWNAFLQQVYTGNQDMQTTWNQENGSKVIPGDQ